MEFSRLDLILAKDLLEGVFVEFPLPHDTGWGLRAHGGGSTCDNANVKISARDRDFSTLKIFEGDFWIMM